MIEKRETGMNVGEVDNEASAGTGGYWGNASNLYLRGLNENPVAKTTKKVPYPPCIMASKGTYF